MESHGDARRAPADVGEARDTVAARTGTPAWYRIGFALLMGCLALAHALPLLGTITMLVVACAGLGTLVGAYVRRTGVAPNAMAAPGATWLTLAYVGVTLVILSIGFVAERVIGEWVWIACAAALAWLSLLMSEVINRSWARWLRTRR